MKIGVLPVLLLTHLFGPMSGGAAQQPPLKNARIGILGAMSGAGFADRLGVFREQLRELGYLEGKNLKLEERWAEGKLDRLDIAYTRFENAAKQAAVVETLLPIGQLGAASNQPEAQAGESEAPRPHFSAPAQR